MTGKGTIALLQAIPTLVSTAIMYQNGFWQFLTIVLPPGRHVNVFWHRHASRNLLWYAGRHIAGHTIQLACGLTYFVTCILTFRPNLGWCELTLKHRTYSEISFDMKTDINFKRGYGLAMTDVCSSDIDTLHIRGAHSHTWHLPVLFCFLQQRTVTVFSHSCPTGIAWGLLWE